VFTFIQYRTYDICPGLVFRHEFNGGVHVVIRLTIFGNFSQCAIYILFFNVNSMMMSVCDQANHIRQSLCFICMYMCCTPFFNVNSTVAVIMSSGDYISAKYDMVIFRHQFSM
jgi:hypothetical protein